MDEDCYMKCTKSIIERNNGKKLRRVAEVTIKRKWNCVLVSELKVEESGFVCLCNEKNEQVVLIRGLRTGVMLLGDPAIRWEQNGAKRIMKAKICVV